MKRPKRASYRRRKASPRELAVQVNAADRAVLIVQITAAHTSLEMLVRQIDDTRRGCGVWPEIRRALARLDELRAELAKKGPPGSAA